METDLPKQLRNHETRKKQNPFRSHPLHFSRKQNAHRYWRQRLCLWCVRWLVVNAIKVLDFPTRRAARHVNNFFRKPLDKTPILCYIITMTTQTTFEPCNQCGNQALLIEGNDGTCLSCLFPAPPKEPCGVLEGCECQHCVGN